MKTLETPVYERFKHAGIECCIRVSPMGGLNGYVRLPKQLTGNRQPSREHGWIGEEELAESFDVHGGITYGPDEDGWIGFDTGHAGDIWPAEFIREHLPREEMPFYDFYEFERQHPSAWTNVWTPQKMHDEVCYLARQVSRHL